MRKIQLQYILIPFALQWYNTILFGSTNMNRNLRSMCLTCTSPIGLSVVFFSWLCPCVCPVCPSRFGLAVTLSSSWASVWRPEPPSVTWSRCWCSSSTWVPLHWGWCVCVFVSVLDVNCVCVCACACACACDRRWISWPWRPGGWWGVITPAKQPPLSGWVNTSKHTLMPSQVYINVHTSIYEGPHEYSRMCMCVVYPSRRVLPTASSPFHLWAASSAASASTCSLDRWRWPTSVYPRVRAHWQTRFLT